MSVTAVSARNALPMTVESWMHTASATGLISVGDWLLYTGQFVMATNSGHSASWKSSGAGVAMESNPVFDPAGRSIVNSAMKIVNDAILHVSASFSGQPALGVGAYPDATGSAVAGATGQTGVGATWNTAAPVSFSADPTAQPAPAPVALVIGSLNFGNAGTGELIIRLMSQGADVRG